MPEPPNFACTVKTKNDNKQVWLVKHYSNLCSAINEFGWFEARSEFLLWQQLLANMCMSLLVLYLNTILNDILQHCRNKIWLVPLHSRKQFCINSWFINKMAIIRNSAWCYFQNFLFQIRSLDKNVLIIRLKCQMLMKMNNWWMILITLISTCVKFQISDYCYYYV